MLRHDPTRCIGCRACRMACQDLHGFSPERFLMEIVEEEQTENGRTRIRYVMRSCRGCRDVVCVKACMLGCLTWEEGRSGSR